VFCAKEVCGCGFVQQNSQLLVLSAIFSKSLSLAAIGGRLIHDIEAIPSLLWFKADSNVPAR
jgi:hypothetical protein